jgi:hypothetical protein
MRDMGIRPKQRITQHKRFVPSALTQIFASQKLLLCWNRYLPLQAGKEVH